MLGFRRILGLASQVTFGDPEISSLKTSFQEKVSLRYAPGTTHSKQLSYTRITDANYTV
jgi:hypothetical protein